jgi:methylated-DNA-[protein]-cysteine S-methyltransferase
VTAEAIGAGGHEIRWSVLEEDRLVPGFGALLLVGDGTSLTQIWFAPHEDRRGRPPAAVTTGVRDDADPVLGRAAEQIGEYFAGKRTTFDLPLDPQGTQFQRRVWHALLEIPFGARTTYGAVAHDLNLPAGASRAVGLANGANPLPIVIPCHRVVGSDGSLTGFGGGLARKQALLDLESAADRLF